MPENIYEEESKRAQTHLSLSLQLILVAHEVGHGGEVVAQTPAEGHVESLALGARALVVQTPGLSSTGGTAQQHQDEPQQQEHLRRRRRGHAFVLL